MKYQEDVRIQAETFYRRNHRVWLTGEFAPRAISLQPPTAGDVAADGGRGAGVWLAHWADYPGKVETVRKRIGHLGTYDVPVKVVLDTPAAAAAAAGCADEWARMVEVLDLFVDKLGEKVRAPLAARAQSWVRWTDLEVNQYIDVIRWLRKHDTVDYYLRQLPIRGVDTKWIETHGKAVNAVHRLQGFRQKPLMVEMRTLDPALPVGDFHHVLCPVTELATREVVAENVIIVENHQSFLALPQLEGTWAMFGGGYRSDTLAAGLGWLAEKNVHYWGDLDSHGFNMVSRTRAVLPAMRTVLMDLDTIIHHEDLAVEESTALPYDVTNLAPGERQALDYLRERAEGRCLRIEQERLDFPWVCDQLQAQVGHSQLRIRPETTGDVEVVRDVVTQAFADVEHSDGSEPAIVDALREAGVLTVSLVAEQDGEVTGHVAASPVDIGDGTAGWYGIGPVAVRPDRQDRGIGSLLMEHVLDTLRGAGAAGAVLLGEPEFYTRFGFRKVAGLSYRAAPAEYFLALPFTDTPPPTGEVSYHPAFSQ